MSCSAANMASPCKKLKTSAGKRHNMDLSVDDLNDYEFGWLYSYNQRALLARVLFKDKRCRVISDLERVKFITTDPKSHEGQGYECNSTGLWYGSLDHFYGVLNTHVKTFENLDIKPFKESECWKEIVSCLEISDFRYVKKPKETHHWKAKTEKKIIQEKRSNLSAVQKYFLVSLEGALKCDMRNGHGKDWLSALFQIFAHCTDEIKWGVEIKDLVPVNHHNTNTVLEVIHGESQSLDTQMLLYNAPYSVAAPIRSPSSSSLSSSFEDMTTDNVIVTRRTVVPDFCVVLCDYPGMFPLVIELKPAQMDNEGLNQNLEQMLSKMFFQDVVFGIVITPTMYHMSVMVKKEGELHSVRFSSGLTAPNPEGELKFSVENFDNLCTIIYRILIWSKKTKCLLETSDENPKKQ